MKRLTESQIRQVIREEIIGLLNEIAKFTPRKIERTFNFGELRQIEDSITFDPSAVRGSTNFSKGGLARIRNNHKAELFHTPSVNTYTVKFNDGDGFVNPSISRFFAKKLIDYLRETPQEQQVEPASKTQSPNIVQKFRDRIGLE